VHIELSKDGFTWERMPDIAGSFSAIQPTILTHKTAAGVKLQILCRTSNGVLAESWSTDEGRTWSPLTASKLPNPGSGVDATTLADGRQVLAYNPTTRDDPVTKQQNPQKGRTPLNLAVSKDGIDWKDVLTFDNDLAGQYSYPAIIQTRDGLIHVVYTYHRKTIKHVVVDPKSF
jgi:predicted neuraminidase